MIVCRPANKRGHANPGWLHTSHTVSFANYYDRGISSGQRPSQGASPRHWARAHLTRHAFAGIPSFGALPNMTTASKLLQQMRGRGFESGGDVYLPPAAALDFAHICRRESLAIAGIEGFERIGGKLRPRLDLITDWSGVHAADWPARVRECLDNSLSFITSLPKNEDIVLSFTVLSEQEW